ncbi:hypothetical protein FACS1894208_11840 [Clostridia bacterium]|nr:hypothetical protein FACS1894208_11840 [Clostridia bacterium]
MRGRFVLGYTKKTVDKWSVIAVLAAAAIIVLFGYLMVSRDVASIKNAEVKALKKYIFSDAARFSGSGTVLISMCDGNSKAKTFVGTGGTFEQAWKAADKAAGTFKNAIWARADIIAPGEAAPESIKPFEVPNEAFFCAADKVVRQVGEGLDEAEKKANAGAYLAGLLQEDGTFVYGYYPDAGKQLENYDMAGHAKAIWALASFRDDGLLPIIDGALAYLESRIKEQGDISFVRGDQETRLGSTALAVVALTEYIDAFGNAEKYRDLVARLADGILELKRTEDKSVYDAQAAFALKRAYELTGGNAYLEGANEAGEVAEYGKFGAGEYLYPEYAMFMRFPDAGANSFFTRQDGEIKVTLDSVAEGIIG